VSTPGLHAGGGGGGGGEEATCYLLDCGDNSCTQYSPILTLIRPTFFLRCTSVVDP
jgi:hypothetical protein